MFSFDPNDLRTIDLMDCPPGSFFWYCEGNPGSLGLSIKLRDPVEGAYQVVDLDGDRKFRLLQGRLQPRGQHQVITAFAGPIRIELAAENVGFSEQAGAIQITNEGPVLVLASADRNGFNDEAYVSLKDWSVSFERIRTQSTFLRWRFLAQCIPEGDWLPIHTEGAW
ncbi:MAG TPA: hypothetical protein VFF71_02245 [Luteimonas sp.]|nr:hypothetical protein [Luteimonas sp.]